MRKKRRALLCAGSMAGVCLVALCAFQIWLVNKNAPMSEPVEYEVGDIAYLDMETANGTVLSNEEVGLSVEGTRIYKNSAIEDLLPGYTSPILENEIGSNEAMIIVDVSITNYSDSEKEIPLYAFQLQSNALRSSVTMDVFNDLNPGQDLVVTVLPGGRLSTSLVYEVFDSHYGSVQKMERSLSECFDLVLSAYPKKVLVHLGSPTGF